MTPTSDLACAPLPLRALRVRRRVLTTLRPEAPPARIMRAGVPMWPWGRVGQGSHCLVSRTNTLPADAASWHAVSGAGCCGRGHTPGNLALAAAGAANTPDVAERAVLIAGLVFAAGGPIPRGCNVQRRTRHRARSLLTVTWVSFFVYFCSAHPWRRSFGKCLIANLRAQTAGARALAGETLPVKFDSVARRALLGGRGVGERLRFPPT